MARKVMFASDRVRQASKQPVTVSPDLDREKKLAVMRGQECVCGHWDVQPDKLGYCRSLACRASRLKHARILKHGETTVIIYR